MHELIEFLKGFNIQNILAIYAIMWYFTRDLKSEMKEIHDEMKEGRKDFKFLNTRLSRTEGTVYGKDIYTPKEES